MHVRAHSLKLRLREVSYKRRDELVSSQMSISGTRQARPSARVPEWDLSTAKRTYPLAQVHPVGKNVPGTQRHRHKSTASPDRGSDACA